MIRALSSDLLVFIYIINVTQSLNEWFLLVSHWCNICLNECLCTLLAIAGPFGYNEVTMIPAGATHIRVTDNSRNYLGKRWLSLTDAHTHTGNELSHKDSINVLYIINYIQYINRQPLRSAGLTENLL